MGYILNGQVAEWPKALVLKTSVQQCTVGSNPTLSAIFIVNMLKIRFALILSLCVYFVLFILQNSVHTNVVLPFFKTFYDIPLFIVLIIAVGIGMTIQFISSFGIRRRKKK